MFSGALGPKRKAELQEIAGALKLSSDGTREELQGRIKKHLDDNQQKLEENPKYAGLYVKRRKGSVQPQDIGLPESAPSSSGPSSEERPSASPTRLTRQSAKSTNSMDPLRETSAEADEAIFAAPTPAAALHDISAMLKNPSRWDAASPSLSRGTKGRARSTVSDADSDAENVPITSMKLSHAGAKELALQAEKNVVKTGLTIVQKTRNVLSDSRNIHSISSVVEFIAVLLSAMQLEWHQPEHSPIPLPNTSLATFTTSYFWTVLLHWALPTVVVPLIAGDLISFSRTTQTTTTPRLSIRRAAQTMNPMTASIARFFVHYVYPYNALGVVTGHTMAAEGVLVPVVQSVDVLGSQWRLWSAGLIMAFSFAEGISQATAQPQQRVALHEHEE